MLYGQIPKNCDKIPKIYHTHLNCECHALQNTTFTPNLTKKTNRRSIKLCTASLIILSGCQHIQIAKNPLPISLTPSATQKALLSVSLPTQKDAPIILTPPNSAIKNKSATKKVADLNGFYLLESWF